jgi:hypothetical protein
LSRGEEDVSLIKEGDHEVVEDLDSSLHSEWQESESSWTEWNESEGSYVWDVDKTQDSSSQAPQNDDNSETEATFAITSENLPFSKMKQLMTIVSWNPWDIFIQVLWNEMKVSEKWLNELKKLIQE